ncbi:porin [Vreelandella olivaria]|uniref:porin n=1 Tax=Vreelandella olivaria TaxID=390919 RepID=UPI00201F25CE|nr:porin [Halomonas olivaria]
MKKTLLATAIVSAFAALGATSTVQAATVYDQDGTRMDIYGRIAMGIRGGGPEFETDDGQRVEIDNGAEFVDVYSRLGLRLSHEITSDLSAFGHVEWRFRGDEQDSPGFRETRQSYLGLKSAQYGTFQAGNFDSFYNQFVSLPFDVYIDEGLEFAGHPKQSRGDSIGYYTPDLSGFTAFLQLKHYSERGLAEGVDTTDEGQVIAAQGGVRFIDGPLTIGLGFVEDVERSRTGGTGSSDGNGEMIYGLIGSYDITDQFTARLGYEGRGHNDTYNNNGPTPNDSLVGYDTFGLGGTFTTGPWAFNVDYYHIDRDGHFDNSNSWAAGGYYKVSSNFDVFAELYNGDVPRLGDSQVSDVFNDLTDDVYWLTGARYHF